MVRKQVYGEGNKMKEQEFRNELVYRVIEKKVPYTRRMLTELFWLEYPVYCAKLLIKSPVADRTAIETLEGIINLDAFKLDYNLYGVMS